MSRSKKYFSTFSGIGGFELGITKAHENKRTHGKQKSGQSSVLTRGHLTNAQHRTRREASPECIGFSEIDKYAAAIYQKQFPNHQNYGDITKINEKKLPNFDLFVGGFPCQAFSIAGKRKGFEDTRGTLFFDVARILKEKTPRLVLLENVKGLLSHDGGRTFKTIITTLADLGYAVEWQVLNAKNFGVPQNRERVYIVGHFGGFRGRQIFPITTGNKVDDSLRENKNQGGARSSCLSTRYGQRWTDETYIRVREATKKGYAVAKVGDSINLAVPNSNTRRGRVGVGVGQTLDTGMQQHTLTRDMKIRRLTPTECERLMGFPDGWTKYGGHKKASDIIAKNPEHKAAFEIISDTQRYKVLGNAVVTNVIEEIISRLYDQA